MSPKFFHQQFPSIRRMQVMFKNEDPSIYIAEYLGAQWVDTSLLPSGSGFYLAIKSVHFSILTSHLDRLHLSLEDAYKDPATRQAAFTYNVQWFLDETHQQGAIEIQCGYLMPCRLGVSEIESISYTNTAAAEAEMLSWRASNGHFAA